MRGVRHTTSQAGIRIRDSNSSLARTNQWFSSTPSIHHPGVASRNIIRIRLPVGGARVWEGRGRRRGPGCCLGGRPFNRRRRSFQSIDRFSLSLLPLRIYHLTVVDTLLLLHSCCARRKEYYARVRTEIVNRCVVVQIFSPSRSSSARPCRPCPLPMYLYMLVCRVPSFGGG